MATSQQVTNNNYHRVCNYCSTTGAASITWTAYTLGATQFSPIFSSLRIAWFLGSCVEVCSSLFAYLSLFYWPLRCISFCLRFPIGFLKLVLVCELNMKTRMKLKCMELYKNWNICNVMKISPLTWSLLLICRRITEFSKPHPGSNEAMALISNNKNKTLWLFSITKAAKA